MKSLPKKRFGGKPDFAKNDTFLQGEGLQALALQAIERAKSSRDFLLAVEVATASDSAFFRSYRSREFRVRLAVRDEFPIVPKLAGDAIFVAVRRLGPTTWMRITFIAPANSPVDGLTDSEAEALFAHASAHDGISVIDDMSSVSTEKEALQ